MTEGVLPFPGPRGPNSGFSGSETSEERARTQDADGTTAWRQQQVMRLLVDDRRDRGATWREVSEALGIHHGAASGVLSNLHKEGHIFRLTQVRNRCKIYVAQGFVRGRDVEAYGRTSNSSLLMDTWQVLSGLDRYNLHPSDKERVTSLVERLEKHLGLGS